MMCLFLDEHKIPEKLLLFRDLASSSAWLYQTAEEMGTSTLGIWGQVYKRLYQLLKKC
jgi:hypothetical protein